MHDTPCTLTSSWCLTPPPQGVPFFFFNDTATTEIYTLSLHDALPIWSLMKAISPPSGENTGCESKAMPRSEAHTSELQSRQYLVCRLLLEKKKEVTRSCPAAEESRMTLARKNSATRCQNKHSTVRRRH